MAIIKQYHADTDTTYVYSSEYYWDPDKKQSRSKRRLIGKIDPETGETIPTGKRSGRPRKTASGDTDDTASPSQTKVADDALLSDQKDLTIRELRLSLSEKEEKIRALEKQNAQYSAQLSKLRRLLVSCIDSIGDV